MKTNKKKYKLLITYLPNYTVKYCFFNVPIKEDEGNGWYSISGYNLVCVPSVYKKNQSYIGVCNVDDLPYNYKELFLRAKLEYEAGRIHAQLMQSYTQLLNNNL